jgi:predicted MFS family arabinose efflux permease
VNYVDVSLVLWVAGSFSAVYCRIQTINPVMYKETYRFNELEFGLAYLPGGGGVIAGGYVSGEMLDRNHNLTSKSIGYTVQRHSLNVLITANSKVTRLIKRRALVLL